ncbi:MAG: hypothetical protein PHI73_03030 [Patescibacteria group bacterium]|nr:hypothetical protein [Patescibacteria group bacterium]
MLDVQQILDGSDKINRMKRQIGLILSMVSGFLDCQTKGSSVTPLIQVIFTFTDQNGYLWQARFANRGDRGVRFEVEISKCSILLYNARRGSDCIPLEHVEKIHEGLPSFLDQVDNKFPELRDVLDFLAGVGSRTKSLAS